MANKLLLFLLVLGPSCFQKEKTTPEKELHQHTAYYTCSMHPQIKEEKPGKCPLCHMNLTKIEGEETGSEETEPIVKLRKAQMKHFTPTFFQVTSMKMTKKIRLLGTVLQSEEKESSIPARIGGRVEKVYIKSTGSLIEEGYPVVDLYSPKLITAGEEYLLAKKSYAKTKTKEFRDLLKQSEERLKLWGIKKEQFEGWYKNRKVPRNITIHSSTTGIVRKRHATVGKYFKEGQNFFELSDLADVWAEMDVYEHDSSLVKIGQKVVLEFIALPGEQVVGTIDFINPVLDENSRTLKVRATIKNTLGKLKPGMVAGAFLHVDIEGRPLVVPRSAIIDTGKRKVVWVKVNDREYQSRVVHTGHESEGYVEIKQGLRENDEVVLEGSFLLDAQSRLFGKHENPTADSP